MTSTEENPPKGRCPVWVKALLVLSLVGNLAVIGLMVGHAMKPSKPHFEGSRDVGWIIRLVPEGQRDAVRAEFDGLKDQLRDSHRNRETLMENVVAAIRIEPYSPEAMQEALQARRTSLNEGRVLVQDTLVGVLAKFSEDERNAFADNLNERLQRARRHRGATE